MMRSLYSGVSGLKNHQTRMDVVGNNISNVNTTGFKSSRVTFADTLSQTLTGASRATENRGGTNPKQIGLGSSVSAVDLLFTDGSVQSTGVNTDLCLSGNGLFVVGEGENVYYTRNGNFSFDEKGNYCTDDGLKVKGWMADDNGKLDTTAAAGFINIPADKTMAAKATAQADYSGNLNSGTIASSISSITVTDSNGNNIALPGTRYQAAALNATTGAWASDGWAYDQSTDNYYWVTNGSTGYGTTVIKTVSLDVKDPSGATSSVKGLLGGTYDTNPTITNPGPPPVSIPNPDNTYYPSLATTLSVFDSEGLEYTVPVLLTKVQANRWNISLNEGGLADSITDKDGNKIEITMTRTPAATPYLEFDTNGGYASGGATLNCVFTDKNGNTSATPGVITVNLGSLTQYAGSNTAHGASDGNAAGKLKSISVDSSGIITGTYTNGVNKQEAQVAIAQFNNAAGLTKIGGSLYTKSNNSGEPNVKTAADLGCKITPSALEMSNVDLATELSDMIVTQRGFQSNSKIITVSDEMIETLVNMKR